MNMEQITASKWAITHIQSEVKHQTYFYGRNILTKCKVSGFLLNVQIPQRLDELETADKNAGNYFSVNSLGWLKSLICHVFEEAKHKGWNLQSALCFVSASNLGLTSTLPTCSCSLPSNVPPPSHEHRLYTAQNYKFLLLVLFLVKK